MHWVVVGLMGAGKTTVGALLAQRSGRRFVDNDIQLRSMTDRTAREIEQSHGMDELHRLEAEALLRALDAADPSVIAAAASVVERADVRDRLARGATVIWLSTHPDELVRRVESQRHRPLARDVREQLEENAARRVPIYQDLADVVVDGSQTPDAIVTELLRRLPSSSRSG